MDVTNEFEAIDIEPTALKLDPENPRLMPSERGGTQDELRRVLLSRFKLEELGESIVAAGFVNLDPIICYRDGDEIVVREGNRRVAALQLLLQPDLAPSKYRDE